MAGLIARLLGGTPDPTRPGAGEGGYTYPRGPMGQTGYPGSTPQTWQTKSQVPGDGDRKLGPPRQVRHRGNITFPGPDDVIGPDDGGGQGPQQDVTANQQAWAAQPPRDPSGQPQQPIGDGLAHGTGPGLQRDDTQVRHVSSTAPELGLGVPGNQNQRNTRYYGGRQAAPGLTSSPAYNGGGPHAAPVLPFTDPLAEAGENRFVYKGGGVESYEIEREIPYSIHARPAAYTGAPSNRGAELSGERYYAPALRRGAFANAGQGRYGQRKKEGPLHRPTTFTQPAPWSANFYDTSAGEQQGTQKQAADMVYVSPAPARSSVTGRRRRA